MFANFTEETATDAGGVLTLLGSTSGMIPFSGSFIDGDLVSYVAVNATQKVAGIGTYSAGTLIRKDTWNYNGAVVDKNPATNIALTGTVTVRCTAVSENLFTGTLNSKNGFTTSDSYTVAMASTKGISANTLYAIPFRNGLGFPKPFNSIGLKIDTSGSAAALVRVGFATANKTTGLPDKLIHDSGDIPADVAVAVSVSFTGLLPSGWFYALVLSNEPLTLDATNYGATLMNPLLGARITGNVLRARQECSSAFTYGSFPAVIPTPTNDSDLSHPPTIYVRD